MADTDVGSGGSYKDKLLQASDHDELSHPDQAPKPKLPPTKDEGSPPMTIKTPGPHAQAPAGDGEGGPTDLRASSWSPTGGEKPEALRSSSFGTPWSPTGSTQSAIDARHKFQRALSGRKPSVKEDYVLKEGGVPCAPQPQHVDDYPSDEDVPEPEREAPAQPAAGGGESAGVVAPGTPGGSGSDTTDGTSGDAPSGLHSQEEQQINITEAGPSTIAGTTLSDIEQQVISDPSTADLVAAAMQPDEAVVRMAEEPPANVMVVEPDETSDVKGIEADVTAVLPGVGSSAGTPIVTAADAAAGTVSSSATEEAAQRAQRAQRAKSTVAGELLGIPIRIREASDAAAAGLGDFDAEGDEAEDEGEDDQDEDRNAPGKALGMETGTSGDTGRRSSDSSAAARADSLFTGGGRIFTASDAAAAGLADITAEADAAEEEDEDEEEEEDGTLSDTKPKEAGAAASYGHLQQAPAASDDPAAMPAPSTPGDTSSNNEQEKEQHGGSSSTAQQVMNMDEPEGSAGGTSAGSTAAGESGEAAHAEPVMGVEKEGDVSSKGADTDTISISNPLKVVTEQVGGAVGAAIGKMADLLVGPDVAADLAADLTGNQDDQQQGLAEAVAEEGKAKDGEPAPFAVL